MNTDIWNDIELHFHEAVLMEEAEQKKFLKNLSQSRPDIAVEVRNLLDSHYNSDDFLDTNILDTPLNIKADDRVGPWKIIREIGRGGMSSVFLAERADGQFQRKVAIKFIYGIAPGIEMETRLRTEQSILAGLNHINICKLLDAGIHENGRPYFIMEFVDGLPINEWCIRHQLTTKERLELFIQVCEAVTYAHQRLIVHRDLKPSNILVDHEGNVKLLDFGIAKLIKKDGERDISKTLTGFQLMTPEFASPEQILQKEITTATDVYGLGLLLFNLLTGTLPYNLTNKSPLEVGRIITEFEPEKPSSRATQPANLTDQTESTKKQISAQRQLSRQLRGDLDNIILKALRKDPARRYSSAELIMQDIYNYLDNKPVMARPESALYRTRKFIQRHKTPVISAIFIVIVLITSSAVSFRQAQIAENQRIVAEGRFNDVRLLANAMIFDIHDSINNLPGSTPARELIVQHALAYLDELSGSDYADETLMMELATAYRKIGDVQGNPTNANLGRRQDAMDSYQKGITLLTPFLDENMANPEARSIGANIYEKIGDVLAAQGELELSKENKILSNQIYKKLADDYPDAPDRKEAFAISLIKLGDLMGNPNFPNLENSTASLEYYREAEDLLLQLRRDQPEYANFIRLLGVVYERLGTIFESQNHLNEALWAFNESMELRLRFAEANPLNTDAIRDEAVAFEKLANVYLRTGKLDESLSSYQKSFEIFEWLADADPHNIQAKQSLAISHIHLGDLYYHAERSHLNELTKAIDHFKASQQILGNILASDSTNSRSRYLLDITRRRLHFLTGSAAQ